MIIRPLSLTWKALFIPVFIVLTLFSQTAGAQETAPISSAAERPGSYTIKEGDTLWDIANTHYRDPFLWPLIWKANPSISDPDLIYPGHTLVIPDLAPVERAMAAPSEETAISEEKSTKEQMSAAAPQPAETTQPRAVSPEESAESVFFHKKAIESIGPEPETPAAASRLIVPEETRPPLVDKYAMLRAGFVSDEEDSRDTVIGYIDDTMHGVDGKNALGYDQEVYISISSIEAAAVGDRFLIYRPSHTVRHPVTGRNFGKLYQVLGILKITELHENKTYKARITLSFDAITKGDLLMPYQEPTLLYHTAEKKEKNLTGYILEMTDTRSISGQTNFVYLDKGKMDGVEPGDRFTVYSGKSSETNLPRKTGEVLVFIVKDRSATAVIQKNTSEIATGDKIVFKN